MWELYHCTLENITDFSCAQNWATSHERSVGVSSIEPARNRQSFFVHIALSCSMRWQGERKWLRLTVAATGMYCITRRGRRVLTDVDTCIRARTSCILSKTGGNIISLSMFIILCSILCWTGSQCRRSGMSAVMWPRLCTQYDTRRWIEYIQQWPEVNYWHRAGRCCSNQSGWWWRHVHCVS